MKMPNFFIIGAPKCGTTSLATWLSQHPQVFMSTPKSLDYYNTDYASPWRSSSKQYRRVFSGANAMHRAVGEASTEYLSSSVAVSRILADHPQARFIVCLRPPIEIAVSWHGQMMRAGREPVADFEQAWNLQPLRTRGNVPKTCPDAKYLLYGPIARVGEQVERLLRLVRRQQVHFILLEDMKNNPRGTYLNVLDFLDVPDDGYEEFPVENSARLLSPIVRRASRASALFKRQFGITRRFGLLRPILKATSTPLPHADLRPDFRKQLESYFEPDQQLLYQLIGRRY